MALQNTEGFGNTEIQVLVIQKVSGFFSFLLYFPFLSLSL